MCCVRAQVCGGGDDWWWWWWEVCLAANASSYLTHMPKNILANHTQVSTVPPFYDAARRILEAVASGKYGNK